jgi:NAD(P)-dependent dehydrogenase (short-subunit alcohol dehydrogenase family)
MINFSLKDKLALITGASRGIGEDIALTLAQFGAHCILVSRKAEALVSVKDKISSAGGTADIIACHVGDLNQIENLFSEINSRFGHLDILVNNAATNPYFGDMLGADAGIWDKTFDVNLKGPFFITQKAIKLMIETNIKGSIVNISSINGIKPAPFQGVYSITKAGLIAMTKSFAKEFASKGIRVNAVLPGLTETKFSKAIMDNDSIYDFAVKQIPMGRHASPSEISGAVLYLVSDASSFTTGSLIVCDGGMLA